MQSSKYEMPVSREQCDNRKITYELVFRNMHYKYVWSTDAWLTRRCYQETSGPPFSGAQAKTECTWGCTDEHLGNLRRMINSVPSHLRLCPHHLSNGPVQNHPYWSMVVSPPHSQIDSLHCSQSEHLMHRFDHFFLLPLPSICSPVSRCLA